jgi:hypothetical protein
LPSTSDLFIRTAKNARYPLVNNPTHHTPLPTINPQSTPRISRLPHPPSSTQQPQPQINYSRTLALGHPPTRPLRLEGQPRVIQSSLVTHSYQSQQHPTFTVIQHPRYISQYEIHTSDPSLISTTPSFRPRSTAASRLPSPYSTTFHRYPTTQTRFIRPTIRIMNAAPKIVPSHQPRQQQQPRP